MGDSSGYSRIAFWGPRDWGRIGCMAGMVALTGMLGCKNAPDGRDHHDTGTTPAADTDREPEGSATGAPSDTDGPTTPTGVDHPPTVRLEGPVSGSRVQEDDPIVLHAVVADAEDAVDQLTVHFASDLTGDLGAAPGDAATLEVRLRHGLHFLTASVSDTAGHTAESSVFVSVNAAPGAPTVAVLPDPPSTDASLMAHLVAPSLDADGDPVTYRWRWFVDDAPSDASDTHILPAEATAPGQRWRVVVTPSDGEVDGNPGEAEVTVVDAVPVVVAVDLEPEVVATDTTVRAVVTASDPDGEALTLHYTWLVNGTPAGTDSSGLSGQWFDRGDTVAVEVVADDGGVTSAPFLSDTVVVVNSPPGPPSVAITPASPRVAEPLLCVIVAPGEDADDDPIVYGFTWTNDGVAFDDATTTDAPGDTIPAGVTADSETWTCTVTPVDPVESGQPASATVRMPDPSPDLDGDDLPDLVFPGWLGSTWLVHSPAWSDATLDEVRVVGDSQSSLAADIDGDGLADLVIAGTRQVYWGRPDHQWTEAASLGGPPAAHVFLADTDGDGIDDLVFTDNSDGGGPSATVRVTRGGDRNLTQIFVAPMSASYTRAAEVADVDGDGWVDLVVAGLLPGNDPIRSHVYYGGPGGLTTTDRVSLDPGQSVGVGIADLDLDGWPDLVFGNAVPGEPMDIYWGSPVGFSEAATSQLEAPAGESLALADLDADGLVDIVHPGLLTDGTAPVYLNLGNRQFRIDRLDAPFARRVLLVDLDGDGLLEVIHPGYHDGTGDFDTPTTIHWGTLDGPMGPPTLLPAHAAGAATAGDLDRDGYPEVIVSESADGVTNGLYAHIFWGSAAGPDPFDVTTLSVPDQYHPAVIVGPSDW